MDEIGLHNHAKIHINGHITRIENSVGAGMPDSSWCVNGTDHWVEYKIDYKGFIYIRPQQVAWHRHH
jgi:hypothetical protein